MGMFEEDLGKGLFVNKKALPPDPPPKENQPAN